MALAIFEVKPKVARAILGREVVARPTSKLKLKKSEWKLEILQAINVYYL